MRRKRHRNSQNSYYIRRYCRCVVKREKERQEAVVSFKLSFRSRSLRNVMWIRMHFSPSFDLLSEGETIRPSDGYCQNQHRLCNSKSAHDVFRSQHLHPAFFLFNQMMRKHTITANQIRWIGWKRFSAFTLPRFIQYENYPIHVPNV